jgi:two-component system cell cycle response regulator
MSESYTISSIGLSDADIGALKRLLILSSVREWVYTYVGDNQYDADIILVNSDIADAVKMADDGLNLTKDSAITSGRLQIVSYASKTPLRDEEASHIVFKLPIVGSNIIHLLDLLVINKSDEIKDPKIPGTKQVYKFRDTWNSENKNKSRPPYNFKVLILEDDLAVRRQMETILVAKGMMPVFAESGEDAIQIVNNQYIQLAYLDILSPGINGYQVCKYIKKSKYTRDIAVVMLGINNSDFSEIRDSQMGGDYYLTKPLSQLEFNSSLMKFAGTQPDQSAQPSGLSLA